MAESMRRRLERAEDDSLAPYALRSAAAVRRFPVEDQGRAFDYRTEFQRDRDRIVYSRAFRRLRQKAVAGILPEYEDHRRNRLTHTLEVSQLARTIGRALRLNEDLIEAVSLGHDLGQPPFGPAGEQGLDDLLSGRLDGICGPGLGDLGGFGRSWQALRVVDLLEKRYERPGLNLTDDVREGILKAGKPDGTIPDDVQGVRPGLAPAFEVQVVRLADRIGSVLHDLDDALQAGTLEIGQVEELRIVARLREKLGSGYPRKGGRFMKANRVHRGLTHLLVTGAILASEKSLQRGKEVGFAPSLDELLRDLEGFLEAKVHRGFRVDRVLGQGRRVVLGLFAAYHADPTLLEDHVLLRYRETAGIRYLRDLPRGSAAAEVSGRYRRDPRFARILGDHVAGMTDAYALAEHARLLEMDAIPIRGIDLIGSGQT